MTVHLALLTLLPIVQCWTQHVALRPLTTLRTLPARCVDLQTEMSDPDAEREDLPPELLGPWEVQCSVSGFGDMWVELDGDGSCACKSSVGKGRNWGATRSRSGRWKLSFVLEDKLKRPLLFEGDVRSDDVRGMAITGSVHGPPKLKAAAAKGQRGVVMGEFAGYKLE